MKNIVSALTVLLAAQPLQPALAPKMPMPFAAKPAPTPKALAAAKATPKAAATPMTTIVIPSANQIHIHNLSAVPAPLTGVAVTYSTQLDNAASSTMYHGNIDINPPHLIKPHEAISFRPEVTLQSPHPTISGQFETITQIIINSEILTLPKPIADGTPIYITNLNGIWQLTAKPSPKTGIASTETTKMKNSVTPKINSMQAAAVPYLKTTQTKLPATPKSPIFNQPKMPLLPKAVNAKSKMSPAPKIGMMPKAKDSAKK